MPGIAEVIGSRPATGAAKAYELILAILFAELAKVAPLSLERSASAFDEIAEATADRAEARVYEKFAMVLRTEDEKQSSCSPRPGALPQLRVLNGGKVTS